jgi:hypothetical protein
MDAHKEGDGLKRELGLSRRQLLKRGAVVGGTLMWATPLIQTIGSPAFAHDVPGTPRFGCCECTGCPSPPGNPQGLFCAENGCLGQAGCEAFCARNGCTGPSTNHCGPNSISCSQGRCEAH